MVQMSMEEEPQEELIRLSVLSQMLSGETLSPRTQGWATASRLRDESRYCGWDCKHWLCHWVDRQTFKETTALWFLCPCLLNQIRVVCARTHFFTHSTNKYCSTPEGGWLSEVPLERWLRGGVAGGSHGIHPNTGKSIPSYCKWSNYITVNLTLTFSATSASALSLHLCNCGKLSTKQKIPAACHRRLVCERGCGRETSVQETESSTFSKGHKYTNFVH